MIRNIAIAALLLLTVGVKAQSQQEWRDSVSNLSRLIEQEPRNVQLRLRKAAANIELEQWRYALDEYSNVLDLQPTNATALYFRGFVNNHLGRHAFARKDYEQLLQLQPLNTHALIGLIETNLLDGRLTAAFDDANRLVEMMPNAEAYATRARVEQKSGAVDAAILDIEQAVSMESEVMKGKYPTEVTDNITAYQLQAFELYMSRGMRTQARGCLDALVANGMPRAYLADYYLLLK